MSWSGCAALRILVVRSLRGDRIFCAVSARAAFRGCVRPSVCRTGSCQGRVGPFREFVRPGASRVFLQSVSMCRHAGPELLCCQADECPGVFPFLDRLRLLFQQPTPPEAGLRLPSFRFAGPRPELPASFAPRLPASLTPGRSGSPRPGSGDMVSYGRGVSSPGQDASGSPQVIPNNML